MKVPRGEKLTHFLYSGEFPPQVERVRHKAFVPPKTSPEQLSVYCISSLTESEIWEIGRKYVQTQRKIRARADFLSDVVYDQDNLKVILDPNPHELHANITPIPIDKEARDEILRELARLSTLVRMPLAEMC